MAAITTGAHLEITCGYSLLERVHRHRVTAAARGACVLDGRMRADGILRVPRRTRRTCAPEDFVLLASSRAREREPDCNSVYRIFHGTHARRWIVAVARDARLPCTYVTVKRKTIRLQFHSRAETTRVIASIDRIGELRVSTHLKVIVFQRL